MLRFRADVKRRGISPRDGPFGRGLCVKSSQAGVIICAETSLRGVITTSVTFGFNKRVGVQTLASALLRS